MSFGSYEKNGKRNRRQRYKCNNCGHVFQNYRHRDNTRAIRLWHQYVHENQTLKSLSHNHGISGRSIRKHLDSYNLKLAEVACGKGIIIMDTSYFRRGFGVMVFRDHKRGKNIFWKYVDYETLGKYQSGIEYLRSRGWEITGIVCDGKRGLFTAFGALPVQMCHFHQTAIITRYITQKPKLQAGKEMKILSYQLKHSSKSEFTTMLKQWHEKWKDFLSEKTYTDDNKRWFYTHKRLRSAYRSLKTNLPYLFTYLDYPEIGMPNTTNSLEGTFSSLKTKIRIHSGTKEWRKKKIIDDILSK